MNTPHNLSVTGPGEIRALSETRVCVFCHTPHNASPLTPLWNRDIKPTNYIPYSSTTMKANIPQPTGPSRLCLSCHDGTVALGSVKSVPGGIQMTRELTSDRRAFLGTDISDDHPVSFSYDASLPNDELNPEFPPEFIQYENHFIHCNTCHDPHENTHGKFLVMNNTYSALCVKCHQMRGWSLASHRSSTATWNGSGNNPWPHTSWLTVAENGCENCHAPHSAGGPMRLLNYQNEEDTCFVCHGGTVAAKDVLADFYKVSRHDVFAETIGITLNAHDPAEDPLTVTDHVECADCHNPHATFSSSKPPPPRAYGSISGVSGVTQFGAAISPVDNEYELCFKCHADSNDQADNPIQPFIPRVVNSSNTRLEFQATNPSFHPVVTIGRNLDVPSIPSADMPALTVSSKLFCTECHNSDDSPAVGGFGASGPHGSVYAPLLRQRYDTADGNLESASSYALCYWCHSRTSILNDESFRKRIATGNGGHSNHLNGHAAGISGAPCSVCHDPHGVEDDGMSGSHTHLINFDTNVVSPGSGQMSPIFIDKGGRSGSCILFCHGFEHTDMNSTYP
ncbi:MAG: cytochrome c3 family protein [Thermodesulfobacteriota bacterium]